MIRTRTALALMLLVLPAPQLATAQRTPNDRPVSTDPRWNGWLGCWMPAAQPGSAADTQVCVVPTRDGRGVQRLTFAGEREILSETFVADGTPIPPSEPSCSGERVSRWAKSGERLFSSSSVSCANTPATKTTGLSSLVSASRWVDVQVVETAGRQQVRTRRFWRSSAAAPAAVADAVRHLTRADISVAALTADDVIEASAAIPAAGVEAWLAESGVKVPINRRTLARLADAKVGSHVIDLMVALAYPRKFEVRRNSGSGSPFAGGSMVDEFYPGQWSYLTDSYGFGFGALGLPYFYGANGYGTNAHYQPGGFYYVPSSGGATPDDTEHGRVVNGQGYTRVQPRETYRATGSGQRNGAQGGANADSGSGGGGSSSGSDSSGGASPAGYSGGGGTSTGLTAVPR
jgi:hypothetical protein